MFTFLYPMVRLPGLFDERDREQRMNQLIRDTIGHEHIFNLKYVPPGSRTIAAWEINKWGWEISAPHRETAALLKLFFPELIEQKDGQTG